MNRMSPGFWDNLMSDKITNGVVDRPLGSTLTKWKSVEEIEPVEVGIKFRVFMVVVGIICLAATVPSFLAAREVG